MLSNQYTNKLCQPFYSSIKSLTKLNWILWKNIHSENHSLIARFPLVRYLIKQPQLTTANLQNWSALRNVQNYLFSVNFFCGSFIVCAASGFDLVQHWRVCSSSTGSKVCNGNSQACAHIWFHFGQAVKLCVCWHLDNWLASRIIFLFSIGLGPSSIRSTRLF